MNDIILHDTDIDKLSYIVKQYERKDELLKHGIEIDKVFNFYGEYGTAIYKSVGFLSKKLSMYVNNFSNILQFDNKDEIFLFDSDSINLKEYLRLFKHDSNYKNCMLISISEENINNRLIDYSINFEYLYPIDSHVELIKEQFKTFEFYSSLLDNIDTRGLSDDEIIKRCKKIKKDCILHGRWGKHKIDSCDIFRYFKKF